jgi:hypothetical protein
LLGIEALVSGEMLKDLLSVYFYYNGEFGNVYRHNRLGDWLRAGFFYLNMKDSDLPLKRKIAIIKETN